MKHTSKNRHSMLLIMVGMLLTSGCIESQDESLTSINPTGNKALGGKALGPGADDWIFTSLKDVRTQKEFRISDFKGKPVLIEPFAVWCPKCKAQQDEIKKLHEKIGDEIISIGIDTDPNEDEDKVREHVTRHGYFWRYAVFPKNASKKLIDEFGVNVVNAPSTPLILVCPDQTKRLLKRGIKPASELIEEVKKGC